MAAFMLQLQIRIVAQTGPQRFNYFKSGSWQKKFADPYFGFLNIWSTIVTTISTSSSIKSICVISGMVWLNNSYFYTSDCLASLHAWQLLNGHYTLRFYLVWYWLVLQSCKLVFLRFFFLGDKLVSYELLISSGVFLQFCLRFAFWRKVSLDLGIDSRVSLNIGIFKHSLLSTLPVAYKCEGFHSG